MVVIASYLVVKFFLKPFILEHEYGGLLQIFVLSYPNFCEAIVGSIFIAFALLIINSKVQNMALKLEEKYIPLLAVLIAGAYVLLQEFKIHNLGGLNVYDPYDVVFSVLGLIIGFYILSRIKPKMIPK